MVTSCKKDFHRQIILKLNVMDFVLQKKNEFLSNVALGPIIFLLTCLYFSLF